MRKGAKPRIGIASITLLVVAVGGFVVLGMLAGSDKAGRQASATVGEAQAGCMPGEWTMPIGNGGSATESGEKHAEATVLACGKARPSGEVRISGFKRGRRMCVAVEYPDRGESHGALCVSPNSGPAALCREYAGCIVGASVIHGYSEISGPVAPNARSVRVSKGGSSLQGAAIALAHVSGRLLRRIGGRHSFGYFAVVAPGCVPENDVRIEVLDGEGDAIGIVEKVPAQVAVPCS